LTHRNLLFLAAGSAKIRALTSDDRLYGALPIPHAVGLSVGLLGTLLSGATLYLVSRFDPMAAPVALVRDRLTVLLGVPAMYGQLLQICEVARVHVPELS
jgi:long-chain acyl-CoA synthetase